MWFRRVVLTLLACLVMGAVSMAAEPATIDITFEESSWVLDDAFELSIKAPHELRFFTGFTGLYFYGGAPGVEGMYVDAIRIETD